MPPIAQCTKCQNGPTGPVGHLDLFILRLSGNTLQFKCAACAMLWTRTTPDKVFEWKTAAEEMPGLGVPGWKSRSPL